VIAAADANRSKCGQFQVLTSTVGDAVAARALLEEASELFPEVIARFRWVYADRIERTTDPHKRSKLPFSHSHGDDTIRTGSCGSAPVDQQFFVGECRCGMQRGQDDRVSSRCTQERSSTFGTNRNGYIFTRKGRSYAGRECLRHLIITACR
jgi:hypothetical protein